MSHHPMFDVEPVDDRDNPVLVQLLRDLGWVWCFRCYMAHSFADWSAENIGVSIEQDYRREMLKSIGIVAS